MSLFDRLFSQRRKLTPTAPHLEAVAVHNDAIFPQLAEQTAQAEVYARSAWVYIAVNKIAEACALVPLQVYARGAGRRVALPDHPLMALLDAPNPYMSRFELFEQTLGMLELTGNAYWYLVGDEAGKPAQIWPLRPDRVSVVPHETNYVAGYLYEVDGRRLPLEAVEVVHFKRWHPGNDYYGLSALEAARVAVQTDRAMSEWNRATFGQNNGVPAGIVNIKEYVSDTDFERIKREWRASYGGPQRKTAFLRGGAIEWQSLGLNHRDMDFLQGRQANRDEILNIFGVPIGLVSENATEANATVAERAFIERTLWPKLVRLAGKITQELMPFWSIPAVADFDDIRPTDQAMRLQTIRAAYPVLTINEIRETFFSLPPVTWGESPASGSAIPAPNESAEPESAQEISTKAMLEEIAQWERFALKRLGQPDARPFNAHVLPDTLTVEIAVGLLDAGQDVEAVKAVFAQGRDQLMLFQRINYPSQVSPLPTSVV